MKMSTFTGILSAVLVEVVGALPTNPTQVDTIYTASNGMKRSGCSFSANQAKDPWVEHGETRWRTEFSGSDVDASAYCGYWHGKIAGCDFGKTLHCGGDYLEVSTSQGAGGDAIYNQCLDRTQKKFSEDNGCN